MEKTNGLFGRLNKCQSSEWMIKERVSRLCVQPPKPLCAGRLLHAAALHQKAKERERVPTERLTNSQLQSVFFSMCKLTDVSNDFE